MLIIFFSKAFYCMLDLQVIKADVYMIDDKLLL